MDLCSHPVVKRAGSNTHCTGECQDRHHRADSKIWIFRPVKQTQTYAIVSRTWHVLRGCDNNNGSLWHMGCHKVPATILPLETKPASSRAGTPKAHRCANLPRDYVGDTIPLPAMGA